MTLFDTLRNRGFLYQLTDEPAIQVLVNGPSMRFYIGIDPTADSLHVGHLLPLMATRWLQAYGHQPIILLGGGTALVGDPSGKTEMRQMLTKSDIARNAAALQRQVEHLFRGAANVRSEHASGVLASPPPAPILVNNGDWLEGLTYINFLRDVGVHFSVNKMLAADSVRLRLETGLSFIEFNYMLLQSYDFYVLARDRGCVLQIGGQDQWGNIVAGVDLVRRMISASVYGLTLPLLTDKQGRKFGKTVAGAVWLDDTKTTIFDYYQFWRNTDDSEVGRLLNLYTLLPTDEVERLGRLTDPDINRAKEILAYETTALVHGADKARDVYLAAGNRFGFADPGGRIPTSSAIREIAVSDGQTELPTHTLNAADVGDGIWIVKLLVDAGLEKSNGAARRLIQGGGAYLNDQRIADVDYCVRRADFVNGQIILRSGKKHLRRVVLA